MLKFINKNKILSGGGKNLTGGGKWGWRGREVGGEGEGSGGRGGGKWGEREVGIGYPPVHPLKQIQLECGQSSWTGLRSSEYQNIC